MKIDDNMSNFMDSAIGKNTTAKTDNFKNKLDEAMKNKDDEALKKVCKEFETYFVNNMLKSMRQTLSGDTLIDKSKGEETFTDMLDEEYSKTAAEVGGIGIAKMLYQQLKRNIPNEDGMINKDEPNK